MNHNLIPTPIVDVNGRQTIVHRSNCQNTPASSALASSRPSASAAPKKKERTAMVEWRMTQMPTGEGFLWDMGTGLGVHNKGLGIDASGYRSYGTGGSTSDMTVNDVIGFMRHGTTFWEAARLIQFKPLSEWEQDEDFQRASGQNRTKFEKTLDLVESKDMKISEVFKLLGNGITDELLESSILTDEQTLSIFSRFKYTHFTASKTAKETPAMIDALLSGSLPYAVFDGGYDKTNVTKLCKELYGDPGKKAELTDSERDDLKQSPEDIVLVLDLIEHQKPVNTYSPPFRDIGLTYRALKEFGEQAVRDFHPEILMSKRRNGAYLGVDGAHTAYSFMRYCEEKTKLKCRHWEPTKFNASVGNGTPAGVHVDLVDIADMADAGISEPAIVHLLVDFDLSVDDAIEKARNSPSPVLLEGEL